MREPNKVLIVGAGIGGLAAAIGLRRVGLEAAVFDKAKDWKQLHVGGGMQLGVNAMKGFRELGVLEAVVASGTQVRKQQVRAANGTLLGDWPVAELARECGLTDIRVVRSRFHEALASCVEDGLVRFGRSCTGFSQDATGVSARFADGSQERGAVLVGADGLLSPIRTQLLGASEPRYAGYAYWRGRTGSPHPLVQEGVSQLFMGCGVRFAYYAVGTEHVSWFSVANGPQGTKPIRKSDILERHRGWAKPIEELIAASDESSINYVDIVDRDPVARWGEGRVTLLGDAAHPMTIDIAQGACQAIEDAVVLAQCLRAQEDPAAALRAYEERRIPRTSQVVLKARDMGTMLKSESRVKAFMRNTFMRLGGWRLLWKRQKAVMTYDFLSA
jgi:2-polyprenyl-6-methoxyphenol hydroxylase-like FAD-dependent oxidoreductase